MTKSELKDIINECIEERYELDSINEDTDIELVEESAKIVLNESFNIKMRKNASKSDIEYYNKVKKYHKVIEQEANKCSELAFKSFKEYMLKEYGENHVYYKDTLEFYNNNKKAPKVSNYEWASDYIDFWFDGKYPRDFDLFFQDEIMKYLKKNEKLKSLGFSFSSEDYVGINILC